MPTEPGTVPGYENVVVHITPGNPPIVDRDPVYVSKKGKNEVVWECADPNFEVIFDQGSPFTSSRFDRSQNHSGLAKGDAKENPYRYKYTVKAGGTLDPETIVDP